MSSGPVFFPHLSPSTAWFAMGASPGRKQNTPKKRHRDVAPPPEVDSVNSAQLLAVAQSRREIKTPWISHLPHLCVTCFSGLHFLSIFQSSYLCPVNSAPEEDLELVFHLWLLQDIQQFLASHPMARHRTCSSRGEFPAETPALRSEVTVMPERF